MNVYVAFSIENDVEVFQGVFSNMEAATEAVMYNSPDIDHDTPVKVVERFGRTYFEDPDYPAIEYGVVLVEEVYNRY